MNLNDKHNEFLRIKLTTNVMKKCEHEEYDEINVMQNMSITKMMTMRNSGEMVKDRK